MAFFSGGQGMVKLLMLYIIERFRTPITREQLYTAMVNVDDTGFFEMSELLAELERDRYLLTAPVRQQQLLFLTEKGAALVKAFEPRAHPPRKLHSDGRSAQRRRLVESEPRHTR